MGIFNDMLGSEESLFKNIVALDYDFQPKLVPYRELEQKHVAMCIKPLLQGRTGRNCFVHGRPGVGKTVAVKHIIAELEEETDDVYAIYINCWQKSSSYKILLDICGTIGYKFTQNKRTDELFSIIATMVNKGSAVFVLDEADKLEELDVIYWILEGIYKKSIILITNFPEWLADLDNRIKSRLLPEIVEFRPYIKQEIKGILMHRREIAFVQGVWNEDAFETICEKTAAIADVRTGLYLMRETGSIAEDESSRKIMSAHADKAIGKLADFTINDSEALGDDEKKILQMVSGKDEAKIGDLYKEFVNSGEKTAYKTFQRRINQLSKGGFIDVKKITGGSEGSTTIVKKADKSRTLDEFTS